MHVIYDSVTNSVFQSMVLVPIMKKLAQQKDLEISVVTFEPRALSPELLMRIFPAHDRLHLIVLKRYLFFGRLTLFIGVLQLTHVFKKLPSQHIVVRGPLAGWIALKMLKNVARTKRCIFGNNIKHIPSLTVQARGLAAEEYRFSHAKKRMSLLENLCYCMMRRTLKYVEWDVYQKQRIAVLDFDVKIESVSTALREYIIKNFYADPQKIFVSTDDVPDHFDIAQIMAWRKEIRMQLQIPDEAYVYCYNGSYKPWQCADETIQFFIEQYKKDRQVFLLILSQDKEPFVRALDQSGLPENSYIVMTVQPRFLYEYLAAADAGLLFRDPDVINWVSRPTKMLEYQSVRIKIIHNGTVECLVNLQK
jgi:hypothetical protein